MDCSSLAWIGQNLCALDYCDIAPLMIMMIIWIEGLIHLFVLQV